MSEIIAHPWFKDIDFKKLESKDVIFLLSLIHL